MRRKTKHLCNYCFMPGQEKEILKTGKTLEQFVAGLGLAGIELLVYRNVPYFKSFEHLAVGCGSAFELLADVAGDVPE
jgi:hypothetical protein